MMTTKTRSTWRKLMLTATVVGVALASPLAGASTVSASAAASPAAAASAPSVTVPRPVIKDALTQFDSLQVPKTARAQCPAGTRVIGGGGRVNGGQHVLITRQQPVQGAAGSLDTFVVSAVEDQVGTSQFWAVQAFAMCSVPLPGLEIVSAKGALGSSAFQVQGVSCPAGKSALGVGGRINGGAGQVSLNTQGENGSLRVAASGLEDLDGFANNWSVTVFGVCATTNFGDVVLVSVQTARDDSARKIFDINCPAGKSVTGGAAFAGFPGVVEVISPTATKVQVIARRDGAIEAWNAIGYAFCAS
jgi:hypothetical protein